MDDVIYEEFKGTGNMEVHLDRRLAERRMFPAIDIPKSSTRRDDLLFDSATYERVLLLRRMVSLVSDTANNPSEPMQLVLDRLSRAKSNEEFLSTLKEAV
jgi:transcription termination factor Rho